MQPINSNQKVEARYRMLLILWFAISMSIIVFLVILRAFPPGTSHDVKLSLILNCLGLAPLAVSFLIKQVLLNRAIELQRLDLVQSAYVVAFALCEAAALLGLMDHLVTGLSYYFIGFGIAGLGMLLHFPQKKPLLDASYKEF